ncbi:MAG: DUF1929 domain-containing protein, partial [Phycisphaerales bacterium]|nr:DUF1929 domain-containing protein [Phycisphaerales bacterium]
MYRHFRRLLHLAAVIMSIATTRAVAQPASQGEWETQMSWGFRGTHLIMLRTGNVLVLDNPLASTTVDTALFEPTSGNLDISVPQQDAESVNVFCSGHSTLSDGTLLIVSGGSVTPGTKRIFRYDPAQPNLLWINRLLVNDELPEQRWYPTCLTLGSGKVAIVGGRDDLGGNCDWPNPTMPANRVLLFDITKAPGQRLSEPEAGDDPVHDFVYYPYLSVFSSGSIFYSGGNNHPEACGLPRNSYLLNVNSGLWTQYGPYQRFGMSAATYKPDGVIKVALSTDGETETGYCTNQAQRSAFKFDATGGLPTWSQLPCMYLQRRDGQLVTLPDGTVGAFGGAISGSETDRKRPEIINPDDPTSTWTLLAAGATVRLYHSAAVLLPDARILFSGGNGNSSAEIFKPPYLFKADGTSAESERPFIVLPTVDTLVKYDASFDLQLLNAADYLQVTQVVLMRLGAATHGYDQDARRVPLSFSLPSLSGPLKVAAPAHSHLAPPGYYMLFVLKQGDRAGIQFPSVAR